MSGHELAPVGREVVPVGREVAPGAAIDWQALQAACAQAWPELVWRVSTSLPGEPWLFGEQRQTYKLLFSVRAMQLASGTTLNVSLTPLRPLPGRWHVYISAEMTLAEAPTVLPTLLADGRSWWGHDAPPKRARKRA